MATLSFGSVEFMEHRLEDQRGELSDPVLKKELLILARLSW